MQHNDKTTYNVQLLTFPINRHNENMSEQKYLTNNMVNDQHHEEVDYADLESPTLAIWRLASPTTDQTERPT